ncbi:hypothetical protein [Microbacterium sp. 1.5R]|uniref:hypothetical protein n=1 Tax=Microbacterium sp. 1.5R TaxID=1916917 RepID=UPI0011A7B8D5|nr:hypothetical protein [Microbacterium sp. 1.5R]
MSDEHQPDLQWGPLEQKPRNAGRVWLIVGLVVAALVVAAVLLFMLLPRGGAPGPDATASNSPSPSPSVSASATPTPSPSEEPTAEPEPSQTPVTTPPPPADPDIEVFRGRVQALLDDAQTGLGLVSETSGQEAAGYVDSLRGDVQRLADNPAPASIEAEWRAALDDYAARLEDLRSAVGADSGVPAAVEAARGALRELRAVTGA